LVHYFGHSAFAVETDGCRMLFDAQDANIRQNAGPDEGFIDLDKLSDKQIYVFYSHSHHDHYSKKLHSLSAGNSRVCTFLGCFGQTSGETNIKLCPRGFYSNGYLTVNAGASTDEGVCFLIQVDGVAIYFAGDNADWGDGESNSAYYGEIDHMSGLCEKIDFAFVPVCTFSGKRPAEMTRGAAYAISKMNPDVTFPMHANGREHLYDAFACDLLAGGSEARIICAKRAGLVYGG